tara:strand:- start:331 stop:822 length:492 start_codon:yes stop_codon:yes gene_type:complete
MNKRAKPIKVLMVCLGNICRSPTAYAVFYKRVNDAELGGAIEVDSAGTGDYHIGEKPDKRARSAAKQRGYDLSGLRARQVKASDFEVFDYILAMDDNNLRDLLAQCPPPLRHKVQLFMEFTDNNHQSVPDPYYSGVDGFQLVLNLAEEASDGLLAHIRQRDLQ